MKRKNFARRIQLGSAMKATCARACTLDQDILEARSPKKHHKVTKTRARARAPSIEDPLEFKSQSDSATLPPVLECQAQWPMPVRLWRHIAAANGLAGVFPFVAMGTTAARGSIALVCFLTM